MDSEQTIAALRDKCEQQVQLIARLRRDVHTLTTACADYRRRIKELEADADPEALQIVYWQGFYNGRDKARELDNQFEWRLAELELKIRTWEGD